MTSEILSRCYTEANRPIPTDRNTHTHTHTPKHQTTSMMELMLFFHLSNFIFFSSLLTKTKFGVIINIYCCNKNKIIKWYWLFLSKENSFILCINLTLHLFSLQFYNSSKHCYCYLKLFCYDDYCETIGNYSFFCTSTTVSGNAAEYSRKLFDDRHRKQ